MSSGKKQLVKKDILWSPSPSEKHNGSFFQPRTPQKLDISISDGTLRTVMQKIDTTNLKKLSSWPLSILHRSVFLAKESMALCHLGAGDLCLVNVDNTSAVFWAWPLSYAEEKIEAVATSDALSLLRAGTSSSVTITRWNEKPAKAQLLRFVVRDERDASLLAHPAFQSVSALLCKNIIIASGEDIIVNYYGRSVRLRAESVLAEESQSLEDVNFLSTQINNISLNNSIRENSLLTSTPCKISHSKLTNLKYYEIQDCTRLEFQVNSKSTSENNEQMKVATKLLQTVGGLDSKIDQIKEITQSVLGQSTNQSFVGVLLYGPSGSGKTMIGKCLPAILQVRNVIFVNGPDLAQAVKTSGCESMLKDVFDQAKAMGRAVIFIDEVDTICSYTENTKSSQGSGTCSYLRSLIDSVTSTRAFSLVLVGSTSRIEMIDPSMRRSGRFEVEIEIGVPNVESRRNIVQKVLESMSLPPLSEEVLDFVAQSAHGYIGADLEALCRKAIDSNGAAGKDSFTKAFKIVKPSAMRQVQVEVPDVRWSDIGGLEELKLHLKQSVEWPLRFPQVYQRLGITPPRGILMYGPPGCSKTMIAKALANESKLNFVSIKGPELFSKWVGDSELAVRSLFERARRVAPCVLFFDEIDALGTERGGGGGGKVGDRVLAQLLTEMDGVEPLKDVTVLAATNRPDMIDKALMRPGRLDRVEFVPLPDYDTRLKIFSIHTRKKPLSDVNLEELATKTCDYTGAEIEAICNEAALKGLEEIMEVAKTDEEVASASTTAVITMSHFEQVLQKIKPRVTYDLMKIYENFQRSKDV